MDQKYESGPNPTVQRVNEEAFRVLSSVQNTTHKIDLPSMITQIDDIRLYTLDLYRIGETIKRTSDDVKHYGPLICLATLQISSQGKRVILYSLSCQHQDTAHGKEMMHYKLSDEDATRAISTKLSGNDFKIELAKKARTIPANDIAIGFDDSQKY